MTWASSDSSVIATDGTVNQPAKGEAAKTVTLTAAVTIRGQTATKEFTVTVNPTTKTAAEQLKGSRGRLRDPVRRAFRRRPPGGCEWHYRHGYVH